jgi:hypothetical protein
VLYLECYNPSNKAIALPIQAIANLIQAITLIIQAIALLIQAMPLLKGGCFAITLI